MKVILKVLKFIDLLVEKFSTYGLVISVFLMLIFSLLTIVFRWLSITSLWFDPFVRHLVFICAFLGGTIATGRGTHIGIDIISKSLEARNKGHLAKYIDIVTSLTAVCTIVWLTKASIDFTLIEFKYGRPSFLNIHTGFLVMIIPIGFSLIGYRFFYRFCHSLFNLQTKEKTC